MSWESLPATGPCNEVEVCRNLNVEELARNNDSRLVGMGLLILGFIMTLSAGFMRWVADGMFKGPEREVLVAVRSGLLSSLTYITMRFCCVVSMAAVAIFLLLAMVLSHYKPPSCLCIAGVVAYVRITQSVPLAAAPARGSKGPGGRTGAPALGHEGRMSPVRRV